MKSDRSKTGSPGEVSNRGRATAKAREPMVRRRPRKRGRRTAEDGGVPRGCAAPAEQLVEDSGGYDPTRPIGKGNPPRAGIIQEGETRNPYGSKGKDGAKNVTVDADMMVAALEKALGKKVSVSRDGRKSKVTILEALCEQLGAEALGGDHDARKLLAQLLRIRISVNRQASPANEKASLREAGDELDGATARRILGEYLRLSGGRGAPPASEDGSADECERD